jgi:uncharacterized protein (DUF58 family)
MDRAPSDPWPSGSVAPTGPARRLFDESFLRKLQQLSIVAKRLSHGGGRGERKTRRSGGGLEFADHREYTAGDDLRRIDWNLYGRIGRPLVRLFDEDEELALYLLVDSSASMGIGARPKLQLACETAAALAYIALGGRDRVAVHGFAGELADGVGPLRGRRQIHAVLRLLDQLAPQGRTDLQAAAASFLARHRRPGLVVILSDFFDPAGAEPTVDRLRARRFEPVLVHLTAWEDRRAPEEDELLLVDSETGREQLVLLDDEARLSYEREVGERLEALARFCRQRSVPCLAASAEQPFDGVVLRLLHVGGLLT